MAIQIRILPPSELYLSDPQQTELGKRILTAGLLLMNRLGLENLTFKKIADEIGSPEASIYRYFSNKNQLLLYLTSWYWEWVNHLVNEAVARQRGPERKLRAAISTLAKPFTDNSGVAYIDQKVLHQLVINEGTKAYRTKLVDQKNSKGLFLGYKNLTEQISKLLLQVDPNFDHPKALASSVFEMAHDHPFFARHIPRLTDLEDNENTAIELEEMLWLWVTRLLNRSGKQGDSSTLSSPFTVFVSRELEPDSPLRQWAAKSGNLIYGRSLIHFQAASFEVPDTADWWFFYSAQAVKFCLSAFQPPDNVRLAALGEGTAKTLRTIAGRVDFIGQGSPGQAAEQFKLVAAGDRVFFPHAKNSRLTVQRLLADHITVLDAVCYVNEPVPTDKPIKTDLFIFTSPLNVAAYLDHQVLPEEARVLAIGGSTAAALYQRGYVVPFPATPSEETLVELIETRYSTTDF